MDGNNTSGRNAIVKRVCFQQPAKAMSDRSRLEHDHLTSQTRWTRGLNALAVGGLLVMVTCLGCGPPSISAPAAYETYNSPDGAFRLEHPDNWKVEGFGGKMGVAWAEASKGYAMVRVDANPNGAAGGGATSGYNPARKQVLAPLELRAEYILHKEYLSHYVEKYTRYKESNGEDFRVSLGHVWRTECTFKKGLTEYRGYRASISSKNHGTTVFAYGPVSQWETLEPIFKHMIDRMSGGLKTH